MINIQNAVNSSGMLKSWVVVNLIVLDRMQSQLNKVRGLGPMNLMY